MSQLFTRIDTIFLHVCNLNKMIEFYTETFDFTLRWNHGEYAAINIGETVLTLVQAAEGQLITRPSHAPFNFYTSDMESAYQRLTERGLEVGPIQGDGDDFKFLMFKDPEGNEIGLCYFPE